MKDYGSLFTEPSVTWATNILYSLALRDMWRHGSRRTDIGEWLKIGVSSARGIFRVYSLTGARRVAWILRLVKTGLDGEGQSTDVMEINRPDNLGDIADLGLTLTEAKRRIAGRHRS